MAKKRAIGLAADFGGDELKLSIIPWLKKQGYKVQDLGTSVNYPDIAYKSMSVLKSGKIDLAVIICRAGTGMSMCANRYPSIRAALLYSSHAARLAREHQDANVAVLAADAFWGWRNKMFLKAFLTTEFSGKTRHKRRIAMLAKPPKI